MNVLRTLLGPAALALIAVAAPVRAEAQASSGWQAWFGCWTASGEVVSESRTTCVTPGDDVLTARFLTIDEDGVAGESIIQADGVARPVEEGGCVGTQSARFSADGRRVFTRSDLTCASAPRVSTGILGFVAGDRWVDSQGLTVRDQHAARTVRYQAVSTAGMPAEVLEALAGDQGLAREAARLDATAPLGATGIIEASAEVAPPALEGFLAEMDQGPRLTADELVMLADHGVPSSTIDVMVALGYPERFVVRETDTRDAMALSPGAVRTVWAQDYCYDPFWAGRFSDCYNSFGYSSAYSRFGYSPWGYDPYGWRYSRSPSFVIVEPEQDTGGRVVRGQGYTPGSGATRQATPRRGSGSESLGPSSRPRNSSGPSGSASGSRGPSSDGGYAPSSGSGSSTRTAKPRGSE